MIDQVQEVAMIDIQSIAQAAQRIANDALAASRITAPFTDEPIPLLLAAYYSAQFAVTYAQSVQEAADRYNDHLEERKRQYVQKVVWREHAEAAEQSKAEAEQAGNGAAVDNARYRANVARRQSAAAADLVTIQEERAEMQRQLAEWHYQSAKQAAATAYEMIRLFQDGI